MLFLCQTLPFPPDGGVHLRSYNILRLLSHEFDVTALCFYRAKTRPSSEQVDASVAGLGRLGQVEAFAIPQEHSLIRLLWDHGRSIVTRRAYTYYSYDSAPFRSRVRELLRSGSFDIVHVDSLDLAGYLSEFVGIPVVCTHHNIESDLLRRRSSTEKSWILRRYLALQADLLEAEEQRWCGHVALNAVVSKQDARLLQNKVPRAPVEVVPNGVDTDFFQPGDLRRHGIVFVGGYGWYPNRDGMQYFADAILPEIRKQHPHTPITWVGRAPEGFAEAFQRDYGITMTGYVDDVRPYLQGASCYIVPLRVGGGTRLKILDAWATGNAVVSTSIGCEGLDAVDGSNILIRDHPRDFAAAVSHVLNEEDYRRSLGQAARDTAETTYEWSVIGRSMVDAYRTALAEHELVERSN